MENINYIEELKNVNCVIKVGNSKELYYSNGMLVENRVKVLPYDQTNKVIKTISTGSTIVLITIFFGPQSGLFSLILAAVNKAVLIIIRNVILMGELKKTKI